MTPLPKVSVVIPTYQEAGFVDRCLRSLVEGSWPLDRLEILLSDGGSTDGTRERIRAWSECCPSIRLVDNPDRYVPQALNRGIEASTGDVIAVMGCHSEADGRWLELVTEDLEEHPEVCGVGGSWEILGNGTRASAIALAQACVVGVGRNTYRNGSRAGYADTIIYGAYRRSVFQRHGGFDEEMVRDQDDEFNIRLLARGEKLWFDPRIRMRYYSRPSFGTLWRQYHQYGFWKVRLWQKLGRLGSLRQFAPMAFVAGGLVSLALLAMGGFPRVLGASFWAAYAALVGLGTLASCWRRPWLWPAAVAAVVTLHLAYGSGFWEGLFRFGILRRGAAPVHVALNR